jgi:H+-transporting ATPase
MGLPSMHYGQITCMVYLKVSLSDFLTLFSSRTPRFFWTQRPGWPLISAASVVRAWRTCLRCASLPVGGCGLACSSSSTV